MKVDVLVSVVIPVYNVRAYLKACLESVLQQTYKNFETIMVDDGSTDGSADLCDEYAKRDSRFSVIHQKNSGVASARNKALSMARGEFLLFIDSDDWIDPDYIESLVKAAEEYNVDFVKVPLLRNARNFFDWSYYESLNKQIIEFTDLIDLSLLCSACGVLIRHKCIGKTIFNSEISYGEDTLFMVQSLLNSESKRILLLKRPFYNYVDRGGSALNSLFNEKWLSLLIVSDKIFDLLEPYPSMRCVANRYKKFCCFKVLERMIACGDSLHGEKKKELRREVIALRRIGLRPRGLKANILELLTLYGGYRMIRLVRQLKKIKNLM